MVSLIKALLTSGRKGEAYDKALATLVLALAAAGIRTDPTLGWDLSEGELEALLLALSGVLATFIGGNGFEHYSKSKSTAPPPQEEESAPP